MAGLTTAEAAARAGVESPFVDQLLDAGILRRSETGLSAGDVRRIGILRILQDAGLPLDAIAAGLERGILGLDFVDSAEYERFAALTEETFQSVSERTGVPLSLLSLLRETVASVPARPEDRIRTDELRVVPFLEVQCRLGFEELAIERLLRALGDSTRRIAEAEAEWWRSQVAAPRLELGQQGEEVAAADVSAELNHTAQEALLAIWNAQQAQTWTSNIVTGFEYLLSREGLYQAPERQPAICFLDITGYTRLTQERGDKAAAEIAENLARLVKRTSGTHGGRPVKWLGDGVMFYFPYPDQGVLAALEMVDGIVAAGLPPAHVGLHAGPVVVQEGDYYGQTVNMAARIAEYARPGEVLVSQAVVDASAGRSELDFGPIGQVDLKGVAGGVTLYSARRGSGAAPAS